MSYGHENSLDIDFGFDEESVAVKDVYLERNEDREWNISETGREVQDVCTMESSRV
jgi:hypothetical protein